ncbi:MAG: NMD protein affecting ribosome stability and mRNA decay [Candidatus Woesearchaeota archaeon]|jgi:NMD protein affecting ribosome stability and mRNA decay
MVKKFVSLVPEDIQLLQGHSDIVIEECPETKKVRNQKRWSVVDIDAFVEKKVRESLQINSEAKDPTIDIELNRNDSIAYVIISAVQNRKTITQEYEVPYVIRSIESPQVSKVKSSYFQGTLRLKNHTPAIIAKMRELINKEDNKGTFIPKEVISDIHAEFRISDQRIIKRILAVLQKRFGGSIKNDAQHFSENKQTSKVIYRVDGMYCAFPYEKGDIVTDPFQKLFRVITLGKQAVLISLDDKEKVSTDAFTDDYQPLPKKLIQLVSTKPILGLHPKTLETIPVEHITKTNEDELLCFISEDQLFAVQ